MDGGSSSGYHQCLTNPIRLIFFVGVIHRQRCPVAFPEKKDDYILAAGKRKTC